MKLWIKRGPTAYEAELDKLRTLRYNQEPGTLEYAATCQAIKDLQEEHKNEKMFSRKFSPETREAIGRGAAALIPGALLTGLNYYLENHEGMLTGRRSKDQDSMMASIIRNFFSGFRK